MVGDIGQWLENLGLGEWHEALLENRVDLDAARDLTEADLRELGIPMGPRKKLLRAYLYLAMSSLKFGQLRQDPHKQSKLAQLNAVN